MKSLKKIGPPVLFLALVILSGFIFRTILVEALILPAASLIWGVGRLLASVDQNVYWIGLILFCIILVGWLIFSRVKSSPNPTYNYSYQPPARLVHWRSMIEGAASEDNTREALRKNMRSFYQAILADDKALERSSPQKINPRIDHTFTIIAAEFLSPGPENSNLPRKNHWQTVTRFIPGWIRRMNKNQIRRHQIIMDELLVWMESELEIEHERK